MILARYRAVAGTIVLAIAIAYVAVMAWSAKGFDFRAYYCAGAVLRTGADPYRTQPLQSCEQHRTDPQLSRFAREAALPAPFPGYAIALMEPLSVLPFKTALALWAALLAISVGLTTLAMWRLTQFRPALIASVLAICNGFTSIGLGDVMPLILCALVLCALALFYRSWVWAACAGAVTLLEPNVGVPVCLSLALWAPQTRGMLAAAAAVLAAMSLGALGVAGNIEYFTRVLPYHAISEIGADAQLSVTAVLHALHWSDAAALRGGAAWYAAMLIAGVVLGRKLALFYRNDAFLALAPAAFAVCGGTFIHVTQAAAAVPLAFLLLRCAPEYRKFTAAALVFLTVPWVWSGVLQFSPLFYVFVAYVAWEAFLGHALSGAIVAACALALLFAFREPSVQGRTSDAPASIAVSIPEEYADAGWAKENLAYLSDGGFDSWVRRAPTWAALLLLLSTATFAASRRGGVAYA